MSETECKYWSFDGGNSQRGICAIDNKFCDCLVGERDCYYKQLKRCEQKLEKIKEKCKFFISECKECKECENPDIIIDCIDCTTGGKAVASYKILNIIEDIERAEDE